MWLIKSIHQRQRTIYKVMQSIIQYQREFFEKGVSHLKPLNLRDVADDIEMHESTVSRVTTNKYVHTPPGDIRAQILLQLEHQPLRRRGGGEREREGEDQEDHREPRIRPVRLSDQRIAEMLKTSDIDIARRTVTKYREAMNILSSTKRRQVG